MGGHIIECPEKTWTLALDMPDATSSGIETTLKSGNTKHCGPLSFSSYPGVSFYPLAFSVGMSQ